ncbi:MAG TPA: ABC transporter permease, partial [Nitrospirales bacterium]|nr:ABC transporter permease [Nitrospirales bacterium]
GLYSLSEASRATVENLEDPVSIRAYFTADLPPPFSSTSRYVKDLLDEYATYSHGMLQYQFIDPVEQETEEDKAKKKEIRQDIFGRAVRERTTQEYELLGLGIPAVQIQVNEGDKLEVKQAYMGIVLRYREKQEVIPLVQDTAGIEYDLTSLIRKLVRPKTPEIAFLTGHEGPDLRRELRRTYGLMEELYNVKEVDLSQEQNIEDTIDGIIIAGAATPFSEAERRAIDQFIMSGRGAVFLLDRISVDRRTLSQNPIDHGLDGLLEHYGVKMGDGLVLDVESSVVNVSHQRRFMQITQPVPYPYISVPRQLNSEHPVTHGLTGVTFPFVSPLENVAAQDAGSTIDMLVTSSEKSWIRQQPFDLHPLQEWGARSIDFEGPQNLVATISGTLKTAFDEPADDDVSATEDSTEASAPRRTETDHARVVVVGGSSILLDQYTSESNQAFVLNLLDWMLLDDAMLSIRTRGLTIAPLDEVSDATRNAMKYLNMLGLPAALVAFGLVRWRIREARRRGLTL